MKSKNEFYNKIESLLISISLIGIILLIGLQIFINHKDLSLFMEQVVSSDNSMVKGSQYNEKGAIELKIYDSKFENLEVLINGESITDFHNDVVRIEVYNNDLIEINGSMYNEKIKVKIVAVSSNLKFPKLNTVIYTSNNIEILDKVEFK